MNENKTPFQNIVPIDGVPPVNKPVTWHDSKKIAAEMGLIPVSRPTLMRLAQLGIDAEGIGISKVTTGSILCSFEGICEVQEKLLSVIADVPDSESISTAANAYASLIRAQAALIKSGGASTITAEKPKSGRRSFAKGEKIGPVVDVKAA